MCLLSVKDVPGVVGVSSIPVFRCSDNIQFLQEVESNIWVLEVFLVVGVECPVGVFGKQVAAVKECIIEGDLGSLNVFVDFHGEGG